MTGWTVLQYTFASIVFFLLVVLGIAITYDYIVHFSNRRALGRRYEYKPKDRE